VLAGEGGRGAFIQAGGVYFILAKGGGRLFREGFYFSRGRLFEQIRYGKFVNYVFIPRDLALP
jgi:hypothetical protein